MNLPNLQPAPQPSEQPQITLTVRFFRDDQGYHNYHVYNQYDQPAYLSMRWFNNRAEAERDWQTRILDTVRDSLSKGCVLLAQNAISVTLGYPPRQQPTQQQQPQQQQRQRGAEIAMYVGKHPFDDKFGVHVHIDGQVMKPRVWFGDYDTAHRNMLNHMLALSQAPTADEVLGPERTDTHYLNAQQPMPIPQQPQQLPPQTPVIPVSAQPQLSSEVLPHVFGIPNKLLPPAGFDSSSN